MSEQFSGEKGLVPENLSSNFKENQNDIEGGKENEKKPIKRIALVTTNQMDTGVRAISQILKDAGFDTMKLSLYEDKRHKTGSNYSDEELAEIVEKLRDAKLDALGISIFEFGSNRAFSLMKKVKAELGIPVILGGQHALQFSKECFEEGADAVCLGEGESGLVELLENWDTRFEHDNPNFIVRKEDTDKERINELRASLLTEEEISKLHPDLTYTDYFVLRDGKLVALTSENIANPEHHQVDRELKTFVYASDRGCPLNCSFCYVSIDRRAFAEADKSKGQKPQPFLRRKAVSAVIEDLVEMRTHNPQVKFINIMNDDTAARNLADMQEFARLYKEKINLPFYCMVSPRSLAYEDKAKEKIQALVDAGVKELNMGIQTNEKTSKEIYNRPQPDKLTLKITDILHEFARENLDVEEEGKIDLFYDFIINNPLETREDIKRTFELIKKIKPPFDLVAHTLYISQKSKMRGVYEEEKTKALAKGIDFPVVLEDLIEQTDFHDTHRFYDELAKNYTFVINAIVEFSAGRHDVKMTGRIPRHAKDLLEFDVFKSLMDNHQSLRDLLLEQEMTNDTLSMDLLASDIVDEYFRNHKDVFKELFWSMHEQYPIHYSNERKEPEAEHSSVDQSSNKE